MLQNLPHVHEYNLSNVIGQSPSLHMVREESGKFIHKYFGEWAKKRKAPALAGAVSDINRLNVRTA